MTEPMTAKTGADPADFISKIPDPDQRKDCETMLRLMRQATGADPEMWGTGIVGFGVHTYAYRKGRAMTCFKLGFAPRGHGLSLYLQTGFEGYGSLRNKIGKHQAGKGCVMIKRLSDVNLPALKDLLRESAHQPSKT